MNSSDRADLTFALADVLNEFADDRDRDVEAVRDEALAYVRGWNDTTTER